MFELKNLKVVKNLKNIEPRLKWLMHSEAQDFTINSRYLDLMSNNSEENIAATEEYLQKTVREILIQDFSPEIKNMKSFDLLVDTVIHNLKKKQLREEEN